MKVGAVSIFVLMLSTLKSYYVSPQALLGARYPVRETRGPLGNQNLKAVQEGFRVHLVTQLLQTSSSP